MSGNLAVSNPTGHSNPAVSSLLVSGGATAELQAAEAAAPLEWKPGDVILDLYEVKEHLGRGGMGDVYRVHHRNWNVDLAVKSLRPDLFQSESHKQSSLRECETWINLGLHPHIVSCYYVRSLGGIPRIFAEYVEGGSLAEWIRSGKLYEGGPKKALERLLDIGIQILWGLHYAHERGVVHQDVKPANVMMTPGGSAKVSDFGLARVGTAIGGTADVPESGILVKCSGMTLAYCSPEQVRGELLTHKTDIWSWAVSMLQMFVGGVRWSSGLEAPQKLECVEGVRLKHMEIPEMPADMRSLLQQCFDQNQEKRLCDPLKITGRLIGIYRQSVSEEYWRREWKLAQFHADVFNNRGVSLLDLSYDEEALRAFDEALRIHSNHPEATYNRAILLWQNAAIADDEVVRLLESTDGNDPERWRRLYLLGLVHVNRGDQDEAVRRLEQSSRESGGIREVAEALDEAKRRKDGWSMCIRTLESRVSIVSIAITPDGRWTLSGSGSSDGLLRQFDLATGRRVRILHGHSDMVFCIGVDSSGGYALSCGNDSALRQWDLATGECVRVFRGPDSAIIALSISPGGRYAFTGSVDETICLWDLSSARYLRFSGGMGTITCTAITPDGRYAIWGGKGRLQMRDLSDLIEELHQQGAACTDGIAASSNKTLHYFTLNNLKDSGIVACCTTFPRDARYLLAGISDKTIAIIDLNSNHCLRRLHGHTNPIKSVAVSADGRHALSHDMETIRFWDLATGRCLRTFTVNGLAGSVFAVAITPDGRNALSATGDNTLRQWQLPVDVPPISFRLCRPTGPEDLESTSRRITMFLQEARDHEHKGEFAAAASYIRRVRQERGYAQSAEANAVFRRLGCFGIKKEPLGYRSLTFFSADTCDASIVGPGLALAPNGQYVVAGASDRTIGLWELATGRHVKALEGQNACVMSAAVSPNGLHVVVGGDKILGLWELNSGRCVWARSTPTSCLSIAITPDSRYALVDANRVLQIVDVLSGTSLKTLADFPCPHILGISPDGLYAVSTRGKGDRTLGVWDLNSGRCVRTFCEHPDTVSCLAISPDGRWVLSGSGFSLYLWDMVSGECIRKFAGHRTPVSCVAISADGHFALSAGDFGDFGKDADEGSLGLWELSTGRSLRKLSTRIKLLARLSISSDGRYVIASGAGIAAWELDWDYTHPDLTDWNEGARIYLNHFLLRSCPVTTDGLNRTRRPAWSDEEFQALATELQHRGFGWLRLEGVRQELEKMAASWKCPPPLCSAA